MVRFALRISKQLYDELKKLAEIDKRSINAEILYIIEQYIKNFNKKPN